MEMVAGSASPAFRGASGALRLTTPAGQSSLCRHPAVLAWRAQGAMNVLVQGKNAWGRHAAFPSDPPATQKTPSSPR